MHRRSRQMVLILRRPPEPSRSEGWSHRMHLKTELNTCQGWEREDNRTSTVGRKIELNKYVPRMEKVEKITSTVGGEVVN